MSFDPTPILSGLKDFQRATVDHAFEQLFAAGSTRRFLVADEVGLGKTMVARGVTAKAIERLEREGIDRIDIVYICSNVDIAAQNVRKLDVAGTGAAIETRLTMLARQVRDLRSRRLNVIALTPGTSFEQASATGRADERHLLYWLLRDAWEFGDSAGPKNLLQATTRSAERFREDLRWFDRSGIDDDISSEFARTLEARSAEGQARGEPTIRERFEALCEDFRRTRKHVPPDQRIGRNRLIGELRGVLAAACVEALEPDLVILDEFQRFKHLLEDDDSEAASLARALFRWKREETGEFARVLMLSATPYRALTVAGDGGGDDHHDDFLATVRFLADSGDPAEELRLLLREYQRELYGARPGSSERLHHLGNDIEALLTRFISRTERIGAAGQHDAMLEQRVRTASPNRHDLRQYLLMQDIAEQLEEHDVTELWKSAPYLLNFLDGYKLRSRFDADCAVPARSRELAALLAGNADLLLNPDRLVAYDNVDPGGPRLRELAADVIHTEAWRMLWIPPSMPYHQLGGAYGKPELAVFTKRLVFSAWRAVPRVTAGVLSYLAERALTLEADENAQNTTERRSTQRNRLAFAVDANERRTGMPALALVYPCVALARAADPREFARSTPGSTAAELLAWAAEQVQPLVDQLVASPGTGADERWYWAAPLLLDAGVSDEWWQTSNLVAEWSAHDPRAGAEGSRWADHIELAHQVVDGAVPLGPKPDDLVDVLALMGVGGLGTVALRALGRVAKIDPESTELRLPAARVAWALRGLFNSPEATALLRTSRAESFWREVLRHATDGDLQAVLDEQAHVLLEAEGVQDKPAATIATTIADTMFRALDLRASRVTYSNVTVEDETVTATSDRLHTAFAMRFGDEEGGDRSSSERPARASQLREAFNSPFWPFVLVSTAVGQEGLDFHPYCHVVVHWNLPTNPVDLEQREGRVHRFKGHAVRKNVARLHGADALAGAGDPWRTAFDLAASCRAPEDSELVPYWVYPVEGGSAIERHVLALPMSRELDRLDALRNALAVYRLAFGQARQEDVIDHLLRHLGVDGARELASELRIDLRPPASRDGATATTTATRPW